MLQVQCSIQILELVIEEIWQRGRKVLKTWQKQDHHENQNALSEAA